MLVLVFFLLIVFCFLSKRLEQGSVLNCAANLNDLIDGYIGNWYGERESERERERGLGR